jgi:hypothetical protein
VFSHHGLWIAKWNAHGGSLVTLLKLLHHVQGCYPKYPDEVDVSDGGTYSRDFIHAVVAEVWGLSFDDISLTDLIQQAKIKALLVDAEAKFANGDHVRAVDSAAVAVNLTLDSLEKAVVDVSLGRFSPLARIDTNGSLMIALSTLREIVLVNTLGLSRAFGEGRPVALVQEGVVRPATPSFGQRRTTRPAQCDRFLARPFPHFGRHLCPDPPTAR